MDEAKRVLDAVDIEPYLAQWVNLSDLEEKLKEITGNDDLFEEISLDEFYDYLINRLVFLRRSNDNILRWRKKKLNK